MSTTHPSHFHPKGFEVIFDTILKACHLGVHPFFESGQRFSSGTLKSHMLVLRGIDWLAARAFALLHFPRLRDDKRIVYVWWLVKMEPDRLLPSKIVLSLLVLGE